MAGDGRAVFLRIFEKLCSLCGTALEKSPTAQAFLAALVPVSLIVCIVFVSVFPFRSGPLQFLLWVGFLAGIVIAFKTFHSEIIRPGLQGRYSAMEQFLGQELSLPESARQFLWKDQAARLGLEPQDVLERLGSGSEYQKGLRALLEQRYDAAILHFKALTKTGNAEQALGNVFLGHALHAKSLCPQALEAYNRAAVMDPESVSAWSGKGRCLLELGQYEDALKALDKSIELDPKIAAIWRAKGQSLQKLGRHREAILALEKAIGLNRPGDAGTWKVKAVSLWAIGHFRESLDACNTSIEMNPDDAEAWKYKGVALVNLGRNRDALQAFDRSLELSPDDGETWKYKGIALENLDRTGDALEAYAKAMELNPRDADAGMYEGLVHLSRKQYESALAAFDRIPSGYNRWKCRGMALAELKRYEEASVELEKADGEKPDQAEIWHWKGQVLHGTGRSKEAILAFHRAVELKPDYMEAWEATAVVMTSLGRDQDAVNALERARKIKESRLPK